MPEVPHVAVFDTAFFAQLPPHAFVYPVPYAWYEQWGVRRFGFHGISHAYCAAASLNCIRRKSVSSSAISAMVARPVPCATAYAWRPRWASRPWKG